MRVARIIRVRLLINIGADRSRTPGKPNHTREAFVTDTYKKKSLTNLPRGFKSHRSVTTQIQFTSSNKYHIHTYIQDAART